MNTLVDMMMLRNEAVEAGLRDADILTKYELEELAHIYNGIGADWMPSKVRDLLTDMHPSLRPCALIHDVQFHEGGTRLDFVRANGLFELNGAIMARRNYAWWDVRRYVVMWQAKKFEELLNAYGKPAFNFKSEGI